MGDTYSKPQRISDGGASEQFADRAVGPDGAVYLTYRTYSTNKASAAIAIVKSTDGGRSFTTPRTVAAIDPFDLDDYGPDTCGDGPFRCASGLNYAPVLEPVRRCGRRRRRSRRLECARRRTVRRRSSCATRPTGSSGRQRRRRLTRPPAGTSSSPTSPPTARRSLWSSRNSASLAYSPDLPPGNTATGTTSGDILDTVLARSTNGGVPPGPNRWSATRRNNPNFENRGTARSPFFGDYNYVSAAPDGSIFAVWTDTRDLSSFTRPRDGNQDEGFDADVRTCAFVPYYIFAAAYSAPSIADPSLLAGRSGSERLRDGGLNATERSVDYFDGEA